MAARRVSKSAIDWAGIAERVHARQGDAYRVFRQNSEKYLNRIVELPENLPKINFEEYKNRITNKAMVAEFEKQYSAIQVAYPKDTSGALKKIEAEEKEALAHADTVVLTKKKDIQHFQQLKDAIKMVPPPEEMTRQMFNCYFPECAINPNKENPGTLPDLPELQLENMHLYGGAFYNYKTDRRNIQTVEEFEEDGAEQLKKQLAAEGQAKAADTPK